MHHRFHFPLILSLLFPCLACCQPQLPIDFDKLDPVQIPASERFPWQPKELVAVRGAHAWKHWGQINCVAYSPDGKTLASGGGSDGLIRLWDQAGRELAALDPQVNSINSIAFSPDGTKLLAGGEETLIHVWDISSMPPKPLPALKPSASSPNVPHMMLATAIDSIAFTPDGKRLACTIGRQTNVRIVLWDSSVWPPKELPPLSGAYGPFAFSRDSKTLATQEQIGCILLWDISTEKPSKRSEGKLPQQRNQMLCMAISPDGKSLVTCHADATAGRFIPSDVPQGDLILWDLTASPHKVKAPFGEFKQDGMFWMIPAAAFSADGKQVAFASNQQHIELWDVAVMHPKKLLTLLGRVMQSGSLAFSPDGKTLASVGDSVLRWDLSRSTPRLLPPSTQYSTLPRQAFETQFQLDYGQNVKKIESITRKSRDGVGKSWNLSLPEEHHLHPHTFSADGNMLAAKMGSFSKKVDEVVKVWNLKGDMLDEYASFIPEPVPGKQVETDAGTGRRRIEDSGSKIPFRLWNLALSPDGRTLAVFDIDGAMQIWDVSPKSFWAVTGKTPKLLGTHSGHTQKYVMGAVRQACFSADGKKLATIGSDRKLIVWEIPTGKKLYSTDFPGILDGVLFSPDGKYLVTLNPNNTNYILRLP